MEVEAAHGRSPPTVRFKAAVRRWVPFSNGCRVRPLNISPGIRLFFL